MAPNRMELREFAEQVLFGTTLAGKLTAPGALTDEHPGPALAAPPAPGKSDFPGLHRLDVYSQSKGRPPSVFVFNAFTESRLAEGKAFNPTKHQAQLARDLENLPQFLGREDDLVLVSRPPAIEFLSRIKAAGFPLPEFVVLGEHGRAARMPPGLAARKLGRLRPWAWGPDSCELLKPLFASVTGETRADEQRFNPGLARLYSKAWSADFLRRMLAGPGQPPGWLCTENEAGVAVRSLADARAAIARIRARGHHAVVVKQALGVAGSNALRLLEPEILAPQWRWLENTLAHGQELVIEPWLDRLRDFSVQLEMTAQGLKLCGFTGLATDARGQFVANFAEPHYHQRLPAAVGSLFREPAGLASRLPAFYQDLLARLEPELRAVDFTGPIGLDALVYRDDHGGVRLKPVVEINPRYTLGRVLVELMRTACQNSAGLLRLVNPAQLRAAGVADFPAYARALAEKFPLQFEDRPEPRLREGALCLNDPAEAKACLAVFQVARSLAPFRPETGAA